MADRSVSCKGAELREGDHMLRFRLSGSRLVRLSVTAAAGVATVVVAPATASASIPDQGTFTNHDDVVAPAGELCDFPVHVIVDEIVHYQVFFDQTEAFARVMLHIDYR